MQLVPEWAPNAHPMIVHFPIAILFMAVAVDVIDLFLRPRRWLRITTITLYGTGAVAAIVTYYTGKAAANAVTLPAAAQTVLTDHAGWAQWTVWFFGLYAVARLVAFWLDREDHLWVHAAFAVVALAGLYLPYQTGDHGAMMVFKYGVGVQAAEVENPTEHDHDEHGGDSTASDSTSGGRGGPQMSESGAWQWQPGAQAAKALGGDAFTWLTGQASALNPQGRETSGHGSVLALRPREPAMFTAGEPLESIQAEAMLNLSAFDGTAMIVHHVQDADNYDFLSLRNGTMRLGRARDGERIVSAEGSYSQSGWLPVRLVSDQDHYRGYVGGELVAHGHGEAPPPGRVGLRLEGDGTVLLASMNVQSLRGGSAEEGSEAHHHEHGEPSHEHDDDG